MPRDDYNPNAGEPDREASVAQSSHRSLRLLTEAVWERSGNEGGLPLRENTQRSANSRT